MIHVANFTVLTDTVSSCTCMCRLCDMAQCSEHSTINQMHSDLIARKLTLSGFDVTNSKMTEPE